MPLKRNFRKLAQRKTSHKPHSSLIKMLRDSISGVSLRRFTLEDKPSLIKMANNWNIVKNLSDAFSQPYTEEDADQFIQSSIDVVPTTRFCIEKNGEYVGNIGLHPDSDIYRKNAEIGYFIGEAFWGQGIATQAIKMMVEYGFKELKIHRIQAGVFDYNGASRKVLEKAGFEYEGTAKDGVFKDGKFYDELKFGILNPFEK